MFNSLLNEAQLFFQEFFFRWVDKSAQNAEEHNLTRKNLYIFPSMRGLVFIGLISVLWLLGTNYQNNLILSLSFFLTSVFVVTILQTHANLSGLHIKLLGAEPAFAGENANFIFSVDSKRPVEHTQIMWHGGALSPCIVNIEPGSSVSVLVPCGSSRRGWLKPGRLLIQSYFPLGLMRCWSYLNWDASALVYPAPEETAEPARTAVEGEIMGEHSVRGGEDFSGLTEYRQGDSLRQVSWKSLARERGLFVKEFSQTMSEEIWLDLNYMAGMGVEQRLSAMCYWALQYHLQDKYYGLRLPGITIPPGKGENHKRRVLEALALYGER